MMTPKRLTVELDRRLDGPHDDEHTAAAADLAAECIRYLNYATGSHAPAGLVFPSTVYSIAGGLSAATHRMIQLFGQLDGWLTRQDAAGLLGTDGDGDTAGVVDAARADLTSASAVAADLAVYLDALTNRLSDLNGHGPNRPGGAL